MKRFLTFAVLSLAAVALWSCDDETTNADPEFKPSAHTISGTWELAVWRGAPLAEGSYVYIEFIRKDRLFKMYDNIDSSNARLRTGTFEIDPATDIIRGLYDYSLGQEWAHRYVISEFSSDRMVWTAQDDPEEVSVYVRCASIPDEITDGYDDTEQQ